MASVDIRTKAGTSAGSAQLDDAIFGIQPNVPVMHQVVTAQLASTATKDDPLKNIVSITVPLNDPTPLNNSEETNTTVGLRKLYLPAILR